MVAGSEKLASQSQRNLGGAISAHQLGSAQRAGILVLLGYFDVGNFGHLFFVPRAVQCFLRRHHAAMALPAAFREIWMVHRGNLDDFRIRTRGSIRHRRADVVESQTPQEAPRRAVSAPRWANANYEKCQNLAWPEAEMKSINYRLDRMGNTP